MQEFCRISAQKAHVDKLSPFVTTPVQEFTESLHKI